MRIAITLGATLLFMPAALHAQQAAEPAPATTQAATAALALSELRSALRDLVVSQEAHHADHATYTSDVAALGLPRVPGADSGSSDLRAILGLTGVTVRVLFADGRGWSGMATHHRLPGRSCVVFMGDPEVLPARPVTMSERRPAISRGNLVCDRH